ncbi:hypothetical protein MLD38_012921 [Melastoma candidum]|uniref:Uncharacterized protein n=1 Tax=Melastoma candidum TaxID=119954 RepID=A0ACB9R9Q0_9MYRT|nr:hypothetical protein MLD38_012921 [Melastoma candidum]
MSKLFKFKLPGVTSSSFVSVKLIQSWHSVNKRSEHEAGSEDELEPVIFGRYEKSKKGDGAAIRKRDESSVPMRVFSSSKYGSNETESVLSSSARFWKEEDEGLGVMSVSLLRRTTPMDSDRVEVKRSENPLEDFRMSMIEMVVERRTFEARDLERLLRCFLSVNSREYHGIIVDAFSELWQMMFSEDDFAYSTK